MKAAAEILFLIYAGLLAREDFSTGRISLVMAAGGSVCGMMMTACRIMTGPEEAGTVVLSHLAALVWGLGMLLLSRLSRGAMGKGDGICFCSFACWRNVSELFLLLLVSLFLSAVFGSVLLLLKKKGLKESLPFLPFVFAGALLLAAAALLQPV